MAIADEVVYIAVAKGFKGSSNLNHYFSTIAKAEGNEAPAICFNDEFEVCSSYGSICINTVNTANGAAYGHEKKSETAGAGSCRQKQGLNSATNSGPLYQAITFDIEDRITARQDFNYPIAIGTDKQKAGQHVVETCVKKLFEFHKGKGTCHEGEAAKYKEGKVGKGKKQGKERKITAKQTDKNEVCSCCYCCACNKTSGIVVCFCSDAPCLVKYTHVQTTDDEQGAISALVLITDKDPNGNGGNAEVVVETGKKAVVKVSEKGTIEAAPDCGGHAHYGCAKVSVDGVCEGGSKSQREEEIYHGHEKLRR